MPHRRLEFLWGMYPSTQLFRYLCHKGRDRDYRPASYLQAQASIAGRERCIGGCDHPVCGLGGAGLPGFEVQRGSLDTETYRVGCASRCSKGDGGQIGSCTANPLLDNQAGAINIAFVQVIAILPAQNGSEVRAAKAVDRATESDISVFRGGTEDGIVDAVAVGNQARVAGNREGALTVGVGSPGLPAGRDTPEGLVGTLEGILTENTPRCGRWCRGSWRGRRWRWHGAGTESVEVAVFVADEEHAVGNSGPAVVI